MPFERWRAGDTSNSQLNPLAARKAPESGRRGDAAIFVQRDLRPVQRDLLATLNRHCHSSGNTLNPAHPNGLSHIFSVLASLKTP